MKLKTFRFAPLAAVLLAAVFLHGCGYRAEAAPLASNAPAAGRRLRPRRRKRRFSRWNTVSVTTF